MLVDNITAHRLAGRTDDGGDGDGGGELWCVAKQCDETLETLELHGRLQPGIGSQEKPLPPPCETPEYEAGKRREIDREGGTERASKNRAGVTCRKQPDPS